MTTAFALMLSTAYEGEMILGIYSSEDAAWEATKEFILIYYPEGELEGSASFEVRPVELGAAAKYHW